MKGIVLFLSITCVLCRCSDRNLSRRRRESVGALHIVTNHATPIHTDINNDTPGSHNENPCPENVGPSAIEPGIGFKVIPPRDTFSAVTSLRKSYPMTSQLDLVRGVTRVVALSVIIFSAAVEFYPVVVRVYNSLCDFFYFNKY